MIYEESFGIIPLKQNQEGWHVFLILHKRGNHWGLPKGKASEGENPFSSAARELEEETGLKVEEVLVQSPIVEKYSFKRRGKKIEKTVTYFPATVCGAPLLQAEEIADGKWVPLEEAFNLLTFKEAKEVLKAVKTRLSL